MPFHPHHMDGALLKFEAVARTVHFDVKTISVLSSVTGLLVKEGKLDQPAFWAQ